MTNRNKKITENQRVITTHKDVFSVVLKQLTEEYGITQEDINDLYSVSVKKYLTPQPPLATVSGQEPEEADYLYFWVRIQSVLIICGENERLYDGLGIGVNKYGAIISTSGSPVPSGRSQRTGLMRWTSEKLEIKDAINKILKTHLGSKINYSSSSASSDTFYIIDRGETIDIYEGDRDCRTFDYVYDKASEKLVEEPEDPFCSIISDPGPGILEDEKPPEFEELVLCFPGMKKVRPKF